jgi:hypothetical protein
MIYKNVHDLDVTVQNRDNKVIGDSQIKAGRQTFPLRKYIIINKIMKQQRRVWLFLSHDYNDK